LKLTPSYKFPNFRRGIHVDDSTIGGAENCDGAGRRELETGQLGEPDRAEERSNEKSKTKKYIWALGTYEYQRW